MSKAPKIDLVIADDWELRGDGSGNVRAMQVEPMRRLCDVFERHGFRASFNVEVMQQLAHLENADRHPELRATAGEWEAAVRDAYGRGHDVQLHLHPQWSESEYDAGRGWTLRAPWSILDYPEEQARAMLATGRTYLEGLIRPLDRDFRCLTFRGGSWCVAPSDHLLRALIDIGIAVDVTITAGIYYDTAHVSLDYRDVEEPFAPYYPQLEDARRVAAGPEPIVAVPTHSFRRSLLLKAKRRLALKLRERGVARWSRRHLAPSDTAIPGAGVGPNLEWENPDSAPKMTAKPSDISEMSLAVMQAMLRDVRRRARATGASRIPVVLACHSKNVGDIEPIDWLLAEVAGADDLTVITLRELALRLQAGEYPVVCRNGN